MRRWSLLILVLWLPAIAAAQEAASISPEGLSLPDITSPAGATSLLKWLAVVTVPLAFLVGSGSAGMALVMPILAPLGDFADVDRSLVVTTYNSIGAILLLVLPTNVILVAGLSLARVPIGIYFKFIAPLVGILTAITLAVLMVGVAVG